jgi:hypothetical protein
MLNRMPSTSSGSFGTRFGTPEISTYDCSIFQSVIAET